MPCIELATEEHRHINARSSLAKIHYVQQVLGDKHLASLFHGILDDKELISRKYCYTGKPIDLSFFKDISNWYNNEINLKLFSNLSAIGVDLQVLGRYSIDNSKHLNNLVIQSYASILGPAKTIKRMNRLNRLYNRTKTVELEEIKKNKFIATIRYCNGIAHSKEVTEFNIGISKAVLEKIGASQVQILCKKDDYSHCGGQTILIVSIADESFFYRFKWLIGLNITRLFAKTYMYSGHPLTSWYSHLTNGFELELKIKEQLLEDKEHYYQLLIEEREQVENQLKNQVEERTQQIAAQNRALRDLITQKDESFANASHELRSPLMLMTNPLEEVLDQEIPPKIRSLINKALAQSESLVYLIDKMLDFEQATNLYSETNKNLSMLLNPFLSQMMDQYSHAYHQKNITYSCCCNSDLTVYFDIDDLTSMLGNLLSNTVKYTLKHGHVSIHVEKTEKHLEISVSNTGKLIENDLFETIFDRFYRLPGQESIQGVGLGLAIVKKLVERHGGSISVCTDNIRGNIFTIKLPVKIITENTPEKLILNRAKDESSYFVELKEQIPSEIPLFEQTTKPTLLVVEDNPALRIHIKEMLDEQYYVLLASNGKEAWQVCEQRHVDMVISDIMMPEVDGLTFIKQIRGKTKYSHTPVLILSAKSDDDAIQQSFQLKCDYLTKPVKSDLLKAKVNAMLDRSTLPVIEKIGAPSNRNTEWLSKIDIILDENYGDPLFATKELSALIAVSERTLQRKLQELTELTPREYILAFRLNKSLVKIRYGEHSLGQVAELCGFTNSQVFSKKFKQQFGNAPSRYCNPPRKSTHP